MLKKLLFIVALAVVNPFSLLADEGMWLLPFLKQQNTESLKKLGLKLEVDDVYSPDEVSLKDAIVVFGKGCTGEIISDEGLVLTNHHCGYSWIQQHSSVDHDYLTDGFWAYSKSEELPTPGLEVRVVDKPELQGEIKAAMAAAGGERAAGCFYNAPVWVFIARDKAYDFSTIDCGLLSENIMLAANALGVGSVCLGSPVRFIMESPQRDAVLQKLGFSDGYELCICISLGYPDEAPAAKPRDISKVRFID